MEQSKKLMLVLVCHQPYIRHILDEDEFEEQNEILFFSISKTYLPLLNLFSRLEKKNLPFKIALVFSAPLCTLLEDEIVQEQYSEWLKKRISLGESEVLRNQSDEKLCHLAEIQLQKAKDDKRDFEKTYSRRLIPAFAEFAKKGFCEILATAGTYAFLPHYEGIKEILQAQIETGLVAHKHFFSSAPEGFYLPENGYPRGGIEKLLRSYGISYTLLDAKSILFSQKPAEYGIFSPYRTDNALALFPCDPFFASNLQKNFKDPLFLDSSADIGFYLPQKDLKNFFVKATKRLATTYCYRAFGGGQNPKPLYDENVAQKKVSQLAKDFLKEKSKDLDVAASITKQNSKSICVLDCSILGQTWAEGIFWLEEVLLSAKNFGITLSTPADEIENVFSLPKILPYPAASSGFGYGEDFLDISNDFMIPYLYKACERMTAIAERFPDETGLKARLLNLGAKELLLAQSGEWAKMLNSGIFREYVKNQFSSFISAFSTVFDVLGSNQMSAEWLCRIEALHPIFPWMNFRIFSKKK